MSSVGLGGWMPSPLPFMHTTLSPMMIITSPPLFNPKHSLVHLNRDAIFLYFKLLCSSSRSSKVGSFVETSELVAIGSCMETSISSPLLSSSTTKFPLVGSCVETVRTCTNIHGRKATSKLMFKVSNIIEHWQVSKILKSSLLQMVKPTTECLKCTGAMTKIKNGKF